MRIHREKIAKVLTDFPAQGEQWQQWLGFHQAQLRYFQGTQRVYFLLASSVLVSLVIALVAALMSANGWLWLVTLVLAGLLVALWYYLGLYTRVLHELEDQTDDLFEKMLAIETKPNFTIAKYLLDLVGQFVSSKAKSFNLKDWYGGDED